MPRVLHLRLLMFNLVVTRGRSWLSSIAVARYVAEFVEAADVHAELHEVFDREHVACGYPAFSALSRQSSGCSRTFTEVSLDFVRGSFVDHSDQGIRVLLDSLFQCPDAAEVLQQALARTGADAGNFIHLADAVTHFAA